MAFRAIGVALALCFCAPAAFGQTAGPALGGRGVVLSSTGLLGQWQDVLGRYRSQRSDPGWRGMITAAAASGDPVRAANRLINGANLVEDRGDAWATPLELMRHGGDCEDFAIAKYFLLLEVGIPASNLRLVAERNPDHMVLLVRSQGGEWLILDNLTRDARAYQPSQRDVAYAFNGEAVWIVLR